MVDASCSVIGILMFIASLIAYYNLVLDVNIKFGARGTSAVFFEVDYFINDGNVVRARVLAIDRGILKLNDATPPAIFDDEDPESRLANFQKNADHGSFRLDNKFLSCNNYVLSVLGERWLLDEIDRQIKTINAIPPARLKRYMQSILMQGLKMGNPRSFKGKLLIIETQTLSAHCWQGTGTGTFTDCDANEKFFGWTSDVGKYAFTDFEADSTPKSLAQIKDMLIIYFQSVVLHHQKGTHKGGGTMTWRKPLVSPSFNVVVVFQFNGVPSVLESRVGE